MSSWKGKRPSSARRTIKYDTFSTSVSCNRLRHVQNILKQSSQDAIDGILCIQGVDSRYNDGTRQLVDFLLFDFFEQRKEDFDRAGFAEETIDDIIILVKRESVHVYCNPLNYPYLLPYIAHWCHLQVHCMKHNDSEDEEVAEDFKIYSFIQMTSDCDRIGIPYSSTVKIANFDMMMIEKWPLVQAFAVENYGSGGFFTMKHEVCDVSPLVHAMYSLMDPVNLEILTNKQLPLFERQWNAMLLNLDTKGIQELGNLTERITCEALHSYFHHGRSGAVKGHDRKESRQPYVLFGENSRRESLESCVYGGQQSDERLQGSLHMVVQAVSPRGPVSCSRTYFFSRDFTPHPISDEQIDSHNQLNDSSLLAQLYMISVEAAFLALKRYAATLSATQACNEAVKLIHDLCTRKRLPLERYLQNRKNIDLNIHATDNNGRRIALVDGDRSLLVKLVEVVMYDVPSVEHQDSCLGSVAFSEAFLDSTIPVTHKDGSNGIDAETIILTQNVPRYMAWADEDEAMTSELKLSQDSSSGAFGRCIISGEKAQITTCNHLDDSQQGQVYIFEYGVVFVHPNFGHIVIPKTFIQTLEFYDGDSPSVMAMLVITYKLSLQCHLPVYLQTTNRMLIIALSPKSKAYKTFFSEIYPLWKEDGQKPTLEIMRSLSADLAAVHESLQNRFQSFPPVLFTPTKTVLPKLNKFLSHFAAGSLCDINLPSDELSIVLKKPNEPAVLIQKEKLVVTIIGGVPGSYVDNLVKVITTTAKQESKWVVLKPAVDSTEPLDVQQLQNSLTATIKAHTRLKPGLSKKQIRAVVVVEKFVDIKEVVKTIISHPNLDSAKSMVIGAVTVCVDPQNFYMDERCTFPTLLDSCAQGWVNNIVFTSSLSPQNPDLADVQHLIRTVNSDVALLLANRAEVTRSPDLELILSETAFSHEDMVRARHLLCPSWKRENVHDEKVQPVFHEIALHFSLPLVKSRLLNQLKALKGSLKGPPFTGNVYHVRGQVRFTDGMSMMDFEYTTLSNSLSITAADLQPAPPSPAGKVNGVKQECYVVFTGCGCQESSLKDWMRKCVPQKLEKKSHRTRESITAEEIKRIQKTHHLAALPEGWFYNGSQYVSLDGDKSTSHPDLEKFVLEHLKAINHDIDDYCARVDAQEYHDLFA